MKYVATIIKSGGRYSQKFNTYTEAAQWLDSENNNLDATTIIEIYDDNGKKQDGFFYTEAIK